MQLIDYDVRVNIILFPRSHGLTQLIIKLMTDSAHNNVILQTVQLAVALLKGGYVEVQVSPHVTFLHIIIYNYSPRKSL